MSFVSSWMSSLYQRDAFHLYLTRISVDDTPTINIGGDEKLVQYDDLFYFDCDGTMIVELVKQASEHDREKNVISDLSSIKLKTGHCFTQEEYDGMTYTGDCRCPRRCTDTAKTAIANRNVVHLKSFEAFKKQFSSLHLDIKVSDEEEKKYRYYVILNYSTHPLNPKIKAISNHVLCKGIAAAVNLCFWGISNALSSLAGIIKTVIGIATFVFLFILPFYDLTLGFGLLGFLMITKIDFLKYVVIVSDKITQLIKILNRKIEPSCYPGDILRDGVLANGIRLL